VVVGGIAAGEKFSGSHSALAFEDPIEVGHIAEARLVAGVKDVLGLTKTLHGILDTAFVHVVGQSAPGAQFEEVGEAAGRQVAPRGKFGERDLLVEVGIEMLDDRVDGMIVVSSGVVRRNTGPDGVHEQVSCRRNAGEFPAWLREGLLTEHELE